MDEGINVDIKDYHTEFLQTIQEFIDDRDDYS